jgi:hypothetical protein
MHTVDGLGAVGRLHVKFEAVERAYNALMLHDGPHA